MEQNKQSAPQNAASEAAVRRQKLADLKKNIKICPLRKIPAVWSAWLAV